MAQRTSVLAEGPWSGETGKEQSHDRYRSCTYRQRTVLKQAQIRDQRGDLFPVFRLTISLKFQPCSEPPTHSISAASRMSFWRQEWGKSIVQTRRKTKSHHPASTLLRECTA